MDLENHGDDLRVAILEVRHYQRTLYFSPSGTTRSGLADFERSFAILQDETKNPASGWRGFSYPRKILREISCRL